MQRSSRGPDGALLPLPWRPTALVMGAVSGLLVLTSLVTRLAPPHPAFEAGGGAYRLLDVSGELNLPTWWSVALLLAAAVATLVLAVLQRANGRRAWSATVTLAVVVLVLSLDEGAAIHERLAVPGADGLPLGGWLVVGVPLALATAGVTTWLARSLPPAVRRAAVAGMLLLLASAVGMEAVAVQLGRHGWAHSSLPVVLVSHVEELGEMLGATVLAVAPLRGLAVLHHRRGVALALAEDG